MNKIASITNTKDNTIFFGFNLKKIKADNPGRSARDVFMEHQTRVTGFTKILYRENSEITYCLRTVVMPTGMSAKASTTTIGLIVMVPGEAIDEIESLSKTLKILLQSNFKNHQWQEITTIADLDLLLNPLDWNKSNNFEIRRKIERITLNNYLPAQNLGFLSKPTLKDCQRESIDFIHPYSKNLGGYEKLLRTMIGYQQPVVISAILSPTKITQQEVDHLHEQINLCERAADFPDKTLQVTRSRARSLTESLTATTLELQDAPFLLSFYISSEKPLDSLLLENAGLALSDASGSSDAYSYSGGYEILVAKSSDESQRIICHLSGFSCLTKDSSKDDGLHRLVNLVGASEASTTFYFPVNADGNLPGIDVFSVNAHPLPKELIDLQTTSEVTTRIGTNNHYGFEQDVLLDDATRRQHTYIVGQTGTGKTTLMKTMIQSDLKAGNGLMVIDPHGELYHDLLPLVPEDRVKDIVLFDPSDVEFPVAINLLEVQEESERDYILKELRAILKRFIQEHFSLNDGSYSGPVFYQHVLNNMLLAMSDSDNPGTLIEFYNIFQSDTFWQRWLPLKWENGILRNWVDETLPNTSYNRINRDSGGRNGDYYSSKFMDFVNDSRIRNIFGQPRSTIDFRKAINENKIIFINLSKGLLGEANASFLGMILMAKITAAFMGRAKDISEGKELKPYYLYVDEFQNIATENFSILLSEARKFGLGLVLANQYLAQVNDLKIKNALLGNVGTIIAFRLGLEDAQLLSSQFQPYFSPFELTNMPNYMAVMRTNVKGERIMPVTLWTILPSKINQPASVKAIIKNSRMKYGTPRRYTEKLVDISLQSTRVSSIDCYFDDESTPHNQRIENLDFSEIILSQFEPLKKGAERLCNQGLNEMIVYLVNQANLPRNRVWKVLDALTEVAPNELFFSSKSIDQRLNKSADGALRKKLDGIRNAKRRALVNYWMEWLEDKCRNEHDIKTHEEIENAYHESQWETVLCKLNELAASRLTSEETRKSSRELLREELGGSFNFTF